MLMVLSPSRKGNILNGLKNFEGIFVPEQLFSTDAAFFIVNAASIVKVL